jgi:hypothetical protein
MHSGTGPRGWVHDFVAGQAQLSAHRHDISTRMVRRMRCCQPPSLLREKPLRPRHSSRLDDLYWYVHARVPMYTPCIAVMFFEGGTSSTTSSRAARRTCSSRSDGRTLSCGRACSACSASLISISTQPRLLALQLCTDSDHRRRAHCAESRGHRWCPSIRCRVLRVHRLVTTQCTTKLSTTEKAVDSMPNAAADAPWLCAEARRGLRAH